MSTGISRDQGAFGTVYFSWNGFITVLTFAVFGREFIFFESNNLTGGSLSRYVKECYTDIEETCLCVLKAAAIFSYAGIESLYDERRTG